MPFLSRAVLIGAAAAGFATGCAHPAPVASGAPPASQSAPGAAVPRIAIMSAFDAEWRALQAATEITGTQVVNNRTLHGTGRAPLVRTTSIRMAGD